MTICNHANCNKNSSYNFPGNKPGYCSFHKLEGGEEA